MGKGPMTGIVSISMVKNEQDIIEPFLRHHSPLMDAMILLDNGSVDRTRSIAAACASELGNIVITDFPAAGYKQGQYLSDALRYAQGAYFADFICFLDADEFLSVGSRTELVTHLSAIPVGSCGNVFWQTFLPDPGPSDDTPDAFARMTWRRRREGTAYSKSILRLGGRQDPGLAVQQGSHRIRAAHGRKLPSVDLSDLPLMHFPIRSVAQLAAKGVMGWKAYLARQDGAETRGEGFQKRRLHDLFINGARLAVSAQDLSLEALR